MVGNKSHNLFAKMKLDEFLPTIQTHVGKIKKKGFALTVDVSGKKINSKTIRLLYFLLNNYEDTYFITIKGLPYCLMSDASEHLVYRKDKGKKYYHDQICKKCHLINNCPGWQKSFSIDRMKVSPVKSRPKEIVVEITTDCNLACRTCSLYRRKTLNTGIKEVKAIIKQLKPLGIKAIRFTGGEPFLNKAIGEMLKTAKENNLYSLVNTNATVLNDSILKLLKKNADNILISLQGFNQKTDNFLTNSNQDFNRKLANIIKLKAKVPIVRIGTVISRTLINNFDSYSKLIRKLGIDNWELYRPIIKGQSEEFDISKKDLLNIMRKLYKLKTKGMKVKIANPVPFCISKNMDLSLATLLGAIADDGHSRIVWDTKGYFKPSYFINKNLGKTIKGAWNNAFLQKINSLDYLPVKCKKCEYLKWCQGGNRAITKKLKDNYFLPDPLMPLSK